MGALSESLIQTQDIYLSIQSVNSHTPAELCAVWRNNDQKIISKKLDPDKDFLSPLALDMLGDDLPTLLQNLLLGIEHSICRVSLDDVVFPGTNGSSHNRDEPDYTLATTNGSTESNNTTHANGSKSQRTCSIRRRELITKNKVIINTKYPLKRMNAIKQGSDKVDNVTAENENKTMDSPLDPSSMPLFCLGGSFPHIDSDEDGDDLTRKYDEGNFLHILLISMPCLITFAKVIN